MGKGRFAKWLYHWTNPLEEKEYVIQKGDNLEAIARALNVPIADLMSANNIIDPEKIKYDLKLKYKTNYYYDDYTPSDDVITFIKEMEGFKPTVSVDGKNNKYIGYGFQKPEHIKMGTMTLELADEIFKTVYLPEMVDDLRRNTPNFDRLNLALRDALLSYMYNTGATKYVVKNPSLLKALTDLRFDDVPALMDWGYNDATNTGIRKRRDAERQIYSGDVSGYLFRYKLGGYLDYLKDGSSIHIKKSHEGKFTEYCGGKVTEECIRKGKNSPSAKVRKQATFAANARKWKH